MKISDEARKKLHIVAKAVRIAYPRVFEPEENPQSGRAEYSVQVRFYEANPDHMKTVETIQAALKEAARAFWGDEAERHYRDAMDSKNTRFLRRDEEGGYWYVSLKRREQDNAPRVVDRNPRVTLTAQDGKIYSGAVCNVVFDIWCYGGMSKSGTKVPYGFSGTLMGIQYVAEGEPFGGAPMAKDNDFEDLADSGDTTADNDFGDVPW